MPEQIKFPEEAARLRLLLNIAEPKTQVAFGQKFGIANKQTCNAYFRGVNHLPIEVALKVAAHYRVTLDWIYGGITANLISEVRDKIRAAESQALANERRDIRSDAKN